MADSARDRQVGDAGLDPRGAVGKIDVEDAGHLGDAEDDRVALSDRAAGQRRACPARDHPHPIRVAVRHHRRDLGGGRGQHHGEGHLAIGGEAIGLEGAALVFGGHQGFGGDQWPQAGQDGVAACQDLGIGNGKGDRHAKSSEAAFAFSNRS